MKSDKGIYVANLTAFRQDKLDLERMCAHADFMINAGVRGICPAGTTGEFLYLSVGEKKDLFNALIEAFRGRVDIWCCTWDPNHQAMAQLCHHVSKKGATGIFLPPPVYYEFSENEIIHFYEFARLNSNIPIYCYNIPKYSNNEITLSVLEKLIDRDIVAGIKDSSADERRIKEIALRFGEKIDILAGGDHFTLKAKGLGANGFISALANVYPELFVQLWVSPAEETQEKISRIRAAIKGYGGVPAMKYLLSRRGYDFGCRFPFQELDESQKRQLDKILPSTPLS